jgi:hypothetical protein
VNKPPLKQASKMEQINKLITQVVKTSDYHKYVKTKEQYKGIENYVIIKLTG